MAEAIVSTLKAKIKANDEELQMFQDKWETTQWFILTDHYGICCFFFWTMWKYLDVYLMLLFRCEDTRVQLNTEITAREEAEAEVKWQWHKSDRFAKFHIWCQVNNCSRKVKMLEEKIEKNDERWAWALGKYIISTRKFDLKFCLPLNPRGHNSTGCWSWHISSKKKIQNDFIFFRFESISSKLQSASDHFAESDDRRYYFTFWFLWTKNTFCCVISF